MTQMEYLLQCLWTFASHCLYHLMSGYSLSSLEMGLWQKASHSWFLSSLWRTFAGLCKYQQLWHFRPELQSLSWLRKSCCIEVRAASAFLMKHNKALPLHDEVNNLKKVVCSHSGLKDMVSGCLCRCARNSLGFVVITSVPQKQLTCARRLRSPMAYWWHTVKWTTLWKADWVASISRFQLQDRWCSITSQKQGEALY